MACGLAEDRARDVAEVLLEGDLLGHTTHGFALLPAYLKAIQERTMETLGEPTVVTDHVFFCDLGWTLFPGPWLVRQAIAVGPDTHRRASGRHDLHPPQSPHWLSAGLSPGGHRRGIGHSTLLFRPGVAHGHTTRRSRASFQPESDRCRHSDGRRSDPDRHQHVFDFQRFVQSARRGRRTAAGAVACGPRWADDRRPAYSWRPTRRSDSTAGRHGSRLQRVCAGPACRGAHERARRSWSRR